MERVDYVDTFITVAEDCPANTGTAPPDKQDNPSIASRTYRLITEHPYEYTSGDVIFTVFADRRDIAEQQRHAARTEFYSKGQPCLRSSDLGKRYGWGVHADSAGRLALYAVDSPEYAQFAAGNSPSGTPIMVIKAMRSSRAR